MRDYENEGWEALYQGDDPGYLEHGDAFTYAMQIPTGCLVCVWSTTENGGRLRGTSLVFVPGVELVDRPGGGRVFARSIAVIK